MPQQVPTPVPQPFLHELITCVRAPAVMLSGRDGQVRPGGVQGVLRQDRRILSEFVVDVDGHEPTPIGHRQPDASSARFVATVRHLGDPSADPTVWLERHRRTTTDGCAEQFILVNSSRYAIKGVVRVRAAVDFAMIGAVKHGQPAAPVPPHMPEAGTVYWTDHFTRSTLRYTGEATLAVDSEERLWFSWRVSLPPRHRWTAGITITGAQYATDPASMFVPASNGPPWAELVVEGPAELGRLAARGTSDLAALTLADPMAPADRFVAAGSPWYLTLFGRDSLWAARLTLPLGTDLAAGTLRTLARRQGHRYNLETGEAPGRILHEIRSLPSGVDMLPPLYFGTVDATPLWICLLHDAWRWGMPADQVDDLIDPMITALGWLTSEIAPDSDRFLAYQDMTGHGLTNQGWKDSSDAIQHPDGTIAKPPIALSEAQAYAYQAGMAGAALLSAFDRPGAAELRTWAGQLRQRFREVFWVRDGVGRFPAIGLERAKTPVPTAASNLGHLLGTGLLDSGEAAEVARRLSAPDLDCGYGLRTMSAEVAGFNPLGYHAGAIWPHDTAIVIQGLRAEGHSEVAASLATGLLRAAPTFDYRLPELFAGTNGRAGEAVLAYPASCRPQAWAAAAVVSLLQAALGITADVPEGTLTVDPAPEFRAWFPLRVSGLQVAGHSLTVAVDAAGQVRVETDAPVTVRTGRR